MLSEAHKNKQFSQNTFLSIKKKNTYEMAPAETWPVINYYFKN